MDPNKTLPSRKPVTAKEIHQAVQNLGFTTPLRIRTNNTNAGDGELISAKTPTDANIGRPSTLKDNIAAAMASPISPITYKLKTEIRRSASSELLKIEGLRNYMGACEAYVRGVEEGWGKEDLLELVEEWRRRDRAG